MTSPYIVSTPLPSASTIQADIDTLMEEIRRLTQPAPAPSPYIGLGPGPTTGSNPFGAPATFGSFGMDLQRRDLESRLAQKQQLLNSLLNPADTSGVPPAPAKTAVLAPRIETPKVGLSDLKIPIPR